MLLDRLRRRRSGPRPKSARPAVTISRPTFLEPALPRLVFFAITALSVTTAGLLTARARAREQARFERASEAYALSVSARLAHYVDALRATGGFFSSSDRVDAREFRRFVATMDVGRRYPGVLGLGYAAVVRARPLDVRVRFLEPDDAPNRASLGFDLYQDPVRRAAMDAAAKTGEAAASDRVYLIGPPGQDRDWGFLLFFPIYRTHAPPPERRVQELRGWAYARFRADNFFATFPTPEGLEVRVLDARGPVVNSELFNNGRPESRRMTASYPIDVGGRVWTLRTGSKGLQSPFERWEGAGLGLLGLAIAFALYRLLSASSRRSVELSQAIAARRESERRFRLISDASPAMIWTAGTDAGVTWYNRSFFEYSGLPLDTMLGHAWEPMIHPDDLEDIRTIYQGAVRDRKRYSTEVRMRRKDGAYRWFRVDAAPFFSDDGEYLGFVGACLDVHESRELELELERRVAARTQELESANKELESFAYSVSHDLRAPLRTIEGFSAVLVRRLGDKLQDEDAGHFRRIRLGVERMGAIIDDLLKFSRMQRAELNPTEIDVTALARAAAAEAARATTQPATLTIQPGLTATADPALLRIVLDNLLSNAYKYSSKTPDARVEVGREDGAFFVRDNGAGFDMVHVEKLFQPFSRLHTREEFEGTGVGLAIVKRIIERHGGRVWAESKVGAGSTFRFTLGEPK